MRYTFDENEDEDSESGIRRSARNSGRESSPAATGPTVTASGRQVRSRATGMYGESLLSGQTTDHASPATGDYVRSEGSEEPERPAHGRSTRAANRGSGMAHSKKRNFESYTEDMSEEDDATSWNGDDEDDDEPDQMDLDDEEEQSVDESFDTDDEPPHLVVRLKIGKESSKSFERPSAPTIDVEAKTEEVSIPIVPVTSAPQLTGMDAARTQPISAPVPAPAATASPPLQPLPPPTSLVDQVAPLDNPVVAPKHNGLPSTSSAQPNGVHPQPMEPAAFLPPTAPIPAPPAAPITQPPAPPATSDPHTLPSLGSLLNTATPPYSTQDAAKPQIQAQPQGYPPVPANAEASRSPKPFAHPLPAPTPATNWQ